MRLSGRGSPDSLTDGSGGSPCHSHHHGGGVSTRTASLPHFAPLRATWMGIIPNLWASSSTYLASRPRFLGRDTRYPGVGVIPVVLVGVPLAHSRCRSGADSVGLPAPARDLPVTIARRRPNALSAIAPMPTVPTVRPPVPEIGTPVPLGDAPAPESITPVGRLRRCTFRRIDQVTALPGRPGRSEYEVMCLSLIHI